MSPHRPTCFALSLLCTAALLAGCDRAVEPPPPAAAPVAASAPLAAAPPPAASAAAAASAPAAGGAPADVSAFREERDLCDHFRGEDPYDAKRAAELAAQMDKFCKGTDARLAGLRRKYAAQPAVLQTLKDYEDHVE